MTYDWRLAVPNLEIRDRYFLRLKEKVEQFKTIHNLKVNPHPEYGLRSVFCFHCVKDGI